jgi:hypothetical protein
MERYGMKRRFILIFALCLLIPLALAVPASAQQGSGVSVTCDNGASFNNGIEITVNQMRAGWTYTATAVGINGFDPVLAVLQPNGNGLCSDDDSVAARYNASLPSTGAVPSSNLSAQVRFDHNDPSGFKDVSLVVGGFGDTAGEFILILEGMAITSADVYGDPFSILVTPGMINSGVPVTTYMIAKTNGVDPLIYATDVNGNILSDGSGGQIGCDDAGTSNLCYGVNSSLTSSYVTTESGRLGGYEYDAMLQLPVIGEPAGNYFNLLMTTYQGNTLGQYVMVFHMGTSAAAGAVQQQAPVATQAPVQQQQQQQQQQPQPGNNTGAASGVSVTCDNGASFNNGVEITVNQMRAGWTYTATAVGINGFDPVLAVLQPNGNGLCSDDDSVAARYNASLPSTGAVPSSNLSAQVRFDHNDPSGFKDVSLVVGGFGDTAGEFILILEGMAITSADVYGDPFSILVTPGMINSGVPVTTYMIAKTNGVDPLIYATDVNGNILSDGSGGQIGCDDAGTSNLCYGVNSSLTSSYVTTESGRLGGYEYDAMLQLPVIGEPAGNYFNLLMTTYQGNTLGQYVMVFHMATSAAFSPSA